MRLSFILILLFSNSIIVLLASFDELISKGESLYAQSGMQNAVYYYE